MKDELLTTLDPASQAMLASQLGPYASRAFATIPYSDDLSFPSHLFRILLLRCLRLPLPLTDRSCRCRRVLDPLATTVQRALGQVFSEDVDALWNELRREFAGKQELESQPTHF